MQVGGAPAPAGRDALGEHFEHVLENVSFKFSVRLRAPYERPERFLSHLFLRRDFGHHLLGEDVERRFGEDDAVERAASHRADSGGALEQFVPRQGKDDSLGDSALPVARTPHALQQGGERSRRAQVANQVDVADVDAEFQRRRGDDGGERAGFEPLFGIEPDLARQRTVVRGGAALAESLREPVGDALGQPSRVDEHDGGAVALDVGGDAVEHLGPVLVRGDGADVLIGHLDGKRHLALVAHVHDRAIGSAVPFSSFRADEQAGNFLDRLLRGAQADALEPRIAKGVEPLQRERQVRAALVPRHGVNLVHDDGARALQHFSAALGRQEDVERLGRGDEDVGAFFEHEPALARRRVARAHRHADFRQLHALFLRERADLAQGFLQVFLDVVAERLQG